jgi:hypothetical protein
VRIALPITQKPRFRRNEEGFFKGMCSVYFLNCPLTASISVTLSCEPRDRVASRMLWSNACSSILHEALKLSSNRGGAICRDSEA